MKQQFADTLRTEILAFLGMCALRLIGVTLRWRVSQQFPPQGAVFAEVGRPVIVAFWHNRQLLMPSMYFREGGKRVHTLISQHRDGRLIARVVRYLGILSVAGSSTRGGVNALRGLIKVIRNGDDAAVTPDGPKGPVYVSKSGVIALASLTGAPIVPMSYSLSRKWTFRSWDKFEVPKPFAVVTTGIGEPLRVPRDLGEANMEHYRAELDNRLNSLRTRLENSDAS